MVEEREVTPILKVEGLTKVFDQKAGKKRKSFKALDDVSFSVQPGKTLGLVGESGCGKSTLGRVILRLLEPTAGQAWLNGENIFQADPACLKRLRRNMQIIFQDPYASLDPRMTIGRIIGEPIEIAGNVSSGECREQVLKLMEIVGLDQQYYNRFPYEFSGGQRQRVCIARALALRPRLIVCDEPVSALDVSIQSQILNLLSRLQEEFSLTYLFISHDLSVIRHISDEICVMYLGRIVEFGKAEDVYLHPLHPYTQCLLASVLPLVPNGRSGKGMVVQGEAVMPSEGGCPFYSRCPKAMDICKQTSPDMTCVEGRQVRCHLYNI